MRQRIARVLIAVLSIFALLVVDRPVSAQGESRQVVIFGDAERVPLMPLTPDDSDHTKWKGADELVETLAKQIRERQAGAPPFRIAVFPFSQKQANKVAPRLDSQQASKALTLQATLISTIRQRLIGMKLERPFMLMDKFALERTFQDNAIDPSNVSPDNVMLPKVLRDLKIDAAVVGIYDDGAAGGVELNWGAVGIDAKLVSSGTNPSTIPISGSPDLLDFDGTETELTSSRFGVSLSARAGENGAWESIPLVVDKNQDFRSQIYALVPPRLRNAEYKIRVACNGISKQRGIPKFDDFPGGILNVKEEEDENRLFGVAVLVDGVNSIYENLGTSTGPLVVHPRDARKWLICRPGYVIGGDDDGNPYIKFVGANPDHSSVEIHGWQISVDEARVLKFANVGQKQGIVAETLGVTDDIGLISVYFFGEILKGDRSLRSPAFRSHTGAASEHSLPTKSGGDAPKPTLGTAAGRAIASRTQAVKVELHKTPVHQIHILYRLAEDCPIPLEDRLVLNAAAQENTGRLRRR